MAFTILKRKNSCTQTAGHNPPLIIKPDLTTELLELTGGVALGVMQDLEYQENTVTLEPGSMIVFYTDGVVEAERENKELFEMDRFAKFSKAALSRTPRKLTNEIFKTVREFAGENSQSDDITCLVLQIT